MASASKKKFGRGSKGKNSGSGAMTDESQISDLPPNAVLSNRDKAQHSKERGLDSRAILMEQRRGSTYH